MNRKSAIQFLHKALPPSDILSTPADVLEGFADHTLMLLDKTPWLSGVPEDLLLSYVLVPRINRERIEAHRQELFGEIWPRIQGKSMADAVLEINYWCLEKATYRSTDQRTASALTVISSAYGRCGEESTLLACALRAVGIPARQVYVPRWAHCNDNHAWVEAWVDGEWVYLGACEPEPTLNSGWFTAAASRAMLIHTQAYGLCPRGEELITGYENLFILNRTANYADTAVLDVTLTQNGAPLAACVRFELVNEAELFPLCTKSTDQNGRVALTVGLGGLHLQVSYGGSYVTFVVDTRKQTRYSFDVSGLSRVEAFVLHAPGETRMDRPAHTQTYRERITHCERLRAAYEQTLDSADPFLRKARGNRAVIEAFLADTGYAAESKRALLSTLSEKDFADVTLPVLLDAMAAPANDHYPDDVYLSAVLCPRVEFEELRPVRRAIREYFQTFRFTSAADVFAWVNANVQDSGCPEPWIVTPADSVAVLESRSTDKRSRRLLAIHICRAMGFPARISPMTGDIEWYQNGEFISVEADLRATASLRFIANGDMMPVTHFTLGQLRGTVFHTVELPKDCAVSASTLRLPCGTYRVVTNARRIDGSVKAKVYTFDLAEGETRDFTLSVPAVSNQKLLYSEAMPACDLESGGKPVTIAETMANGGIVALIAPHQEPSYHLLNEAIENKDRIVKEGRKILLITKNPDTLEDPILRRVIEELRGNAIVALCKDFKAFRALRGRLQAGDLRLPLTIAVNAANQALFAFANYHVGTVETILNLLNG